ncbi:hypothetical protein MAUB1S_11482 [Mycolicibacterium aubagnense]
MGGLDDLAVDTVGKFNDGSVLGALCVLLMILLVYREGFYWSKQVKKLEDEIDRSHEAHDKTRTALLEEVRKGGETLVLVREQLKTQQSAVDSLMKLVSEWTRSRGGAA